MRIMKSPRREAVSRFTALVMAAAATIAFGVSQPDAAGAAAHRNARTAMGAGQGGCAMPDSELIEYVDTIVAGNDSLMSIKQRQWSHLPHLPASSVSVVMDSVVCHRAAVAAGLSRKIPDSMAVTGVSVLRVGPTRYVVTDTGSYAGEFRTHLTFDSAFTVPPLAVWGH